jgi:methionine-rich copper-binding protein CopC
MIASCLKDLAGNSLPQMGTVSNTVFTGNESYAAYNMFYTTAANDTTAPSLDKVIPNLNSTNVAVNVSPRAIFSEPIDPNTVIDANTYMTILNQTPHTPITLKQSPSGQSIIFQPLSVLSTNTSYVMHYSSSTTDYSGNSLSAPQTSSFTTISSADTTAPTVISTTPTSGATNQSPYTKFLVYFSEPMNASSFNGSSVTFSQGGTKLINDLTLSDNGYVLTITPGLYPLSNATYTVALNPLGVAVPITDLSGNALANSSYTFTVSADGTAPTLTAIYPANGATNVPISSITQLIFSERLDTGFIKMDGSAGGATGQFRICKGCNAGATNGTTVVTIGSAADDFRVIVVDPYDGTAAPFTNMTASTQYRVRVKQNGPRDLSGNLFATNAINSFTTGTTADTTAPTISSTVPTNNATSVALNSTLVFNFSEALDLRTVHKDNNLFFYNQNGELVSADLSYNSTFNQFTMTPKSNLSSNTCYYWVVTTALRDAGGGNRLATTQSGKFSTGVSACP